MVTNEHALTYIKERYKDELQRLKDVEDKSIKLTSLLSILIAALGTGLGINREPLISPTSAIDWVLISLSVFIFIFLISSWSNALLAIKIGYFPIVPHNREALEYINEAEKEDCEEYIIRCHIDTIELLSFEIEKKVDALLHCYEDLTISALLAFILFISFYISELQNA